MLDDGCIVAFAFVLKTLVLSSLNRESTMTESVITLAAAVVGGFVVTRLMLLLILLYHSQFKCKTSQKAYLYF